MFPLFSHSKMSVGLAARRSATVIRALVATHGNCIEMNTRVGLICSRNLSVSGFVGIGETWPKRRESKANRWNRAIANADRFLGFPDILMSDNKVFGLDVLELSGQLRKIMGTSHPLLKTTKNLVHGGQQNMQVRGLVILLWAKGLLESKIDRDAVMLQKELHIATITELFHMGLLIHSGIVDVEKVFGEEDVEVDNVRHANKLAIIIGDLLFAKANILMGKMENAKIAYDGTRAVLDYTEGEFMLESDKHGQAVPTETTNLTTWEERSFKMYASLLAHQIQAIYTLHGLAEKNAKKGFDFGKNFCLAWRASEELQAYVDGQRRNSNETLNLVSLPVILQIERDPGLLELVTPHSHDLSKVEYKKVLEVVRKSQSIEEARNKCNEYVLAAQKHLQELQHFKTQEVLRNILFALEV